MLDDRRDSEWAASVNLQKAVGLFRNMTAYSSSRPPRKGLNRQNIRNLTIVQHFLLMCAIYVSVNSYFLSKSLQTPLLFPIDWRDKCTRIANVENITMPQISGTVSNGLLKTLEVILFAQRPTNMLF